MTGDIHFGDEVNQYGNNNTGIVRNQGPTDPRLAFWEMISAVQVLRTQVSAADRRVIGPQGEPRGRR